MNSGPVDSFASCLTKVVIYGIVVKRLKKNVSKSAFAKVMGRERTISFIYSKMHNSTRYMPNELRSNRLTWRLREDFEVTLFFVKNNVKAFI